MAAAAPSASVRTIILPESSIKVIRAIRSLNPFGGTHKIRKTYASVLLSSGVDEKLITSQMGHTDIAVTRDIYYFNRDSREKNKLAISRAINF